MPSTGFLRRSVNVLSQRAQRERDKAHPWRQRLLAMPGGLTLAAGMFFLLKGAIIATGNGLPGQEGVALWLAGSDPVSSALGAMLQPVFAARG